MALFCHKVITIDTSAGASEPLKKPRKGNLVNSSLAHIINSFHYIVKKHFGKKCILSHDPAIKLKTD